MDAAKALGCACSSTADTLHDKLDVQRIRFVFVNVPCCHVFLQLLRSGTAPFSIFLTMSAVSLVLRCMLNASLPPATTNTTPGPRPGWLISCTARTPVFVYCKSQQGGHYAEGHAARSPHPRRACASKERALCMIFANGVFQHRC